MMEIQRAQSKEKPAEGGFQVKTVELGKITDQLQSGSRLFVGKCATSMVRASDRFCSGKSVRQHLSIAQDPKDNVLGWKREAESKNSCGSSRKDSLTENIACRQIFLDCAKVTPLTAPKYAQAVLAFVY